MKNIKIILLICVLFLSSCWKNDEIVVEKNIENNTWIIEVETWVVDELGNKEIIKKREFCKIWDTETHLTSIEGECSNYFIEDNAIKYKQCCDDSSKIYDVDFDSFVPINKEYGKDKNSWYYNWYKIRESDWKTFNVLNKNYSYDKNYAFYNHRKLEWSDWKTFEALNDYYAKDKNQVYRYNNILKNIDVKTFEYIGNNFIYNYTKDKNFVYYNDEKIEKSDSKTFEVFDENRAFSKDKNFVYFEGKIIPESNSETFKILSYPDESGYSHFWKDKNFAYYENQKIEDIDIETFKVYDYLYAIDKNSLFFKSFKLDSNTDIDTFKILGKGFSIDKNFAYNWNKLIEYSNGPSFEIIDKYYQKDKNFVYLLGKKIKNSHWPSFEILNENYAKDNNQVYFNREIIQWADSKSFKVNKDNYFTAEDKNFKYIWLEKRDKKSAVKNYIEAYFSTNYYSHTLLQLKDKFQINNKDWELVLNIKFSPDDDTTVSHWYYENEMLTCGSSFNKNCLPRGDEIYWRELEIELKKNFSAVKKLTININGRMVYKDEKYYMEDGILWISSDWRYAETNFPYYWGWPWISCFFVDMKTWECLFESSYYLYEEKGKEFVEKKYDEIRGKYKLKKDFDKGGGFFLEKYNIRNDVEIIWREYWSKELLEELKGYWITPTEEDLIDYPKTTDIVLKHPETGVQVTIEEGIWSNFGWFYWHNQMQGIISLTWAYREGDQIFSHSIIPQDLLDSKLSILYNNVAMHYYNKKEYTKALEYFQKSIEINDKYWQAYYNKSCTYSLLWQKTEAIQTLKQALEIDNKTFKEKAKKDSDFDSIRNEEDYINLVK